MSVTQLDGRSALVVIDLQNGIVAYPTAHDTDTVIERANELATAFRAAGLPVVWVTVAGLPPGRADEPSPSEAPPAGWSDLAPQVRPETDDMRIIKRAWSAFGTTDLDAQLRKHAVTQVVLAGIATSMGVESTARFAHEHGYNVTIATDAITDMNADAHEHSLTQIFPQLAETGTTGEIIDLLTSVHR